MLECSIAAPGYNNSERLAGMPISRIYRAISIIRDAER